MASLGGRGICGKTKSIAYMGDLAPQGLIKLP